MNRSLTGTVTGSHTVIGTLDATELAGYVPIVGLAQIEVYNAGASALSDFQIEVRDHPSGEWYDYLAGSDFQSSGIANLRFSGPVDATVDTLASLARAHLQVRFNGADAVRFVGSVASGSAAITILVNLTQDPV